MFVNLSVLKKNGQLAKINNNSSKMSSFLIITFINVRYLRNDKKKDRRKIEVTPFKLSAIFFLSLYLKLLSVI